MKLKIKVKKNGPDDVSLSFIGKLTIYSVKNIKSVLLGYINKYTTNQYNLSEVSDFDTAGFQLLMYMKQLAAKNNNKIIFTDGNEKIDSLFALYGEQF